MASISVMVFSILLTTCHTAFFHIALSIDVPQRSTSVYSKHLQPQTLALLAPRYSEGVSECRKLFAKSFAEKVVYIREAYLSF